ncbi:site-specific integrase [Nonomuraea muscovyensis]|uniref:site-specific integrase n=1 Tax=Nonomuraea muscovyensis TaxID=1124761 RepID=UPI0033C127E8
MGGLGGLGGDHAQHVHQGEEAAAGGTVLVAAAQWSLIVPALRRPAAARRRPGGEPAVTVRGHRPRAAAPQGPLAGPGGLGGHPRLRARPNLGAPGEISSIVREQRAIGEWVARRMLNTGLAKTGLIDATGGPLLFTPHDFRRLFLTDAILIGLPPHIAQVIAGHKDINVTLNYKAVYPDEVIQAHLAFLSRRRALRPTDEYRAPTDEEWQEFLGHFEMRKVATGTCGRAFGTPCIHERSCLRGPLHWPPPSNATASPRSATTSKPASPRLNAKARSARSKDFASAWLAPKTSSLSSTNELAALPPSTSACPPSPASPTAPLPFRRSARSPVTISMLERTLTSSLTRTGYHSATSCIRRGSYVRQNRKLKFALLAFNIVGLAMTVTSIAVWISTGTNSTAAGQLLLNGGLLILLPTSVVTLVLVIRENQNSSRR